MAVKYLLVFLALLVEHLSFGGKPPSCPPCSKAFCVQPKNCKGGRVMDTCGCCLVCAKVESELCGGKWMIEGKCDKKLTCVPRDRHHRSPWPNIGHCEPAACANKKCGFRQECTLNRRGHPHCVCPRNCRNRPVIPVCGYSNGKQYNNDCELYRHECKSRRTITLMHGPCKKCIYKGRKYKFDDVRPGDNSCELCVCRHGEWTCRMKKNCRVRSCSHEVRARDGQVTSPCPRGFTCKIQIPGIPEQDIPAVAECVPLTFTKKPVKVTRKRPGFHRPARCMLQSETGPCRSKIIRWYYSPHRGKCLKFNYGGCGGNLNRFPTKSSCRTICKKGTNSRKPPIVSTVMPITGTVMNPKICLQPKIPGPCRAYFERWYYDSAKGRCLKFVYGGCDGNHNNFKTTKECETACPGGGKKVTGNSTGGSNPKAKDYKIRSGV